MTRRAPRIHTLATAGSPVSDGASDEEVAVRGLQLKLVKSAVAGIGRRSESDDPGTAQSGFDTGKNFRIFFFGAGKSQTTGFMGEAVESFAEFFDDRALDCGKTRWFGVFDRIHRDARGLGNLDGVFETDIAAGVNTLGKNDDGLTARDRLKSQGGVIEAVPESSWSAAVRRARISAGGADDVGLFALVRADLLHRFIHNFAIAAVEIRKKPGLPAKLNDHATVARSE